MDGWIDRYLDKQIDMAPRKEMGEQEEGCYAQIKDLDTPKEA
jgi:hypothetical protein